MGTASGFEPRRRARRRALQALYQWRMTGRDPSEIMLEFLEEQDFSNVDETLFRSLVGGVTGNEPRLEVALQEFVDRPMQRLDIMERVILDIAALEMLEDPGTPARVIMDEAIGLAHLFGAELGHSFINGVLDKAAHSWRPGECGAGVPGKDE